jgi:NAD(P)-dependent dehydrogenase (short-subunit alcohol dehydrogenase family)
MARSICLITGATDGIGKVTAAELAARDVTVAVAARNPAKAEAVRAEIAAAKGGDVDILEADLTSLAFVRRLARTFNARYPRLDILINNAGVLVPRRQLTEDGFETTYQINYLSGFLLTHLLLDALRCSAQGRNVNLSSSVYAAGRFDETNLQSERSYSAFGAYAASKLFVLLSTLELAVQLKGTPITVNAVHPGIVRTQMMLRAPGPFRIVSWLAMPFGLSPQKGAVPSLYLAASPEVKDMSGRYFSGCKPTAIKTNHNTAPTRRRLWDVSMASLLERGLLDG